MGLGLVIGDVSLQVLVFCSVEMLNEAVRVELRWLELVVDDFDFQALLVLWAVLGLGMAFMTLVAH